VPSRELDLEDMAASNMTWQLFVVLLHMIASIINTCELAYSLVSQPSRKFYHEDVADASVAASSLSIPLSVLCVPLAS